MVALFAYLKSLIKSFVKKEEGQALSEYGLILALIAVVVIAALILLGQNLLTILTNIAGAL